MAIRNIAYYGLSIAASLVLLVLSYMFNRSDSTEQRMTYVSYGLSYSFLWFIYVIYFFGVFKRVNQTAARSPDIEIDKNRFILSFATILMFSFPLLLIALASRPVTTDVLQYLQYGLMILDGKNPYTTRAADFASVLSSSLGWPQTCAYGPISVGLFSLAASVLPKGIAWSILVLKLFGVLAHVMNGYLIWRTKRECATRSLLTMAYLLNPMAILEFVVNARIDAIVCMLVFMLVINMRKQNYFTATLVLLSALLLKSLVLIYLPLYFIYLVSRKKFKDAFIYIIMITFAIFLLTTTLLPSRAAWASLLNPGVKWMSAGSIHQILETTLLMTSETARRRTGMVFNLMTSGIFCVIYGIACWKLLFKKDATPEDLIRLLAWFTLALFLIATPWYQPWYATSLLPFFFLRVRAPIFLKCASIFAISGSTSYYTLAYCSDRPVLLAVSLLTVLPVLPILIPRLLYYRKTIMQTRDYSRML